MTMMISKFHKLIQSRILWGAFLVIIVFSFVIWGMVWPSDLQEAEAANAAGMLDGEPVSPGEFRSAYLSTYLARALTLGREIESTPQTDAILRNLTWQRLATLREVTKAGIVATDPELRGAIRSNFVETNGAYNPQRYQAFLQNVIRPLGFTPAQFEQHLREEIQIQKMAGLIGRQAHVTPLEVSRTFETLLDTNIVEYIAIGPADVEGNLSVADEEARRVFDEDPAAFTIPAQREVSYAAFPVADYLDETAEISDEDIQDYYELHIEDYTTTEDGPDGQPRQTVAELDDVRAEIVTALRRESAVGQADAAAMELVNRAIPGRDGTVPDFAVEVEKTGRQAQKLPPFARFDEPLADAGAAFAAAAFELESGAFDRVSAPVAGRDQIYVIYLEREIASRVPTFEEARERALEQARQKALAEALAARANALQEAAEAGLAAGKTFAESVADSGGEVVAAEPFSGLSGSSSTNEIVQALVQAVASYNPGEVTEPVPFESGVLVAHLRARVPADPATFDAYRAEIASAIRSRRGQGLFRDWQEALLAPERFTDLQRVEPAAEDDLEEGADGEPEEDAPGSIPAEDRQSL